MAAAILFSAPGSAQATTAGAFHNYETEMCLVPYGNSDSDGANLVQYKCSGSIDQKWHMGTDNQGRNTIVNNNGKCMTLFGGATDPGTYLVQYRCNNSTAQVWVTDTAGDIIYDGWRYIPDGGGRNLCASVLGGSFKENAQITAWTCNGQILYEEWSWY